MSIWKRTSIGLLLLLILISYPYIAGRFHVYLLTEILIYSIFGVSFYLLIGHMGYISFGHAAYFGIGAYTTALTLIHFPKCPLLIALFLGSFFALICGMIISLLVLRLTKIHFALGTLAFSQMLWALAWKWRSLTGGDDGLIGWSSREMLIPFVGNFGISNTFFMYYLVACLALGAILLCWYFTQTPLGNTLTCLKSNPDRIQFIGVNVYVAKFIWLVFSAAIAGLAGGLHALFNKVVSPGVMDTFMSFDILIICVLGGYSNFLGPILGAIIFIYLGEYLSSYTEKWQLIMGSLFVLIVLFFPAGLVEMIQRGFRKIPILERQTNAIDSSIN